MELDLSSLVDEAASTAGVSALGQTSSSGDSLFAIPFGACTTWQTLSGGTVSVKFIFDPNEAYDQTAILGSMTEYVSEMREALCKHLLDPADLVSEQETLKDSYMAEVRKLPTALLRKYGEDKALLDEYLTHLKQETAKAYNEKIKFSEALHTRTFDFVFTLAIDCFPQSLLKLAERAPTSEKTGVLTFRIVGTAGPKPVDMSTDSPTQSKSSPAEEKGGWRTRTRRARRRTQIASNQTRKN